MVVSISGLSAVWKLARVLAAILASALYADKLGIVDVTGWLRDRTDTPGGGGG